MASARSRRREKQFEELAKENARLHRDVEDLERAFFLHRQILEEEENSVRGQIRKEVGGSRWEHGGTGKLTTYKCSKDLQESAGNQTGGKYVANGASAVQTASQTGRKPADSGSTLSLKNETHISKPNTKTTLNGKDETSTTDLYAVGDRHQAGDSDSGKILDLKTKILKKARSKVINRDHWHSPVRLSENKAEIDNVGNISHKISKNEEKATKGTAKPKGYVKPMNKSQKENLKSETYQVDRNKQEKAVDEIKKHGSGHDCQKANDIADEIHNIRYEVRQSRRDMHDNEKDKPNKPSPLKVDKVEGRLSNTYNVKETDIGKKESDGAERKIEADMRKNKLKEATEILIDPINAQVKVRYGDKETSSDYSRFEGSKIAIEPEVSSKPDAGGNVEIPQSFKFSILDRDEKPQMGSKIPDVFGLQELVSKSDIQNGVKKTTASLSPLALTKECDTEVEFWLRGLGLADIEEYVEMFAENEIDLLDLEFMSVAQLHDMGVTDPDALNKILKGVRELRNLPPDKISKRDNTCSFNNRKGLQATSIAWEDPDLEQSRKESSNSVLSGRKFETSESHNIMNKTYTKGKRENLKPQDNAIADVDSSRCDSVKSNNSAYSRTSGNNQTSFLANAQSRASRRKQKSQLTNSKPSDRNQKSQSANADTRASSRPNSGKSDKIPPASKSQPQKRTPSQPNKQQKPAEPSADNKSRLQALETKPTRSVLLKRSSSLTRESGRGQGRKASKGQDDLENRRPAVRQRSRSAEAVKRKALEGVQAAAKKNEERLLKDRENEETKNKIQEKKKAERDEMAARHLKREKNKITMIGNAAAGLEDKEVSPHPAGDSGLENLVTVNILSQTDRKETIWKTTEDENDKSKTRVIPPTAAARKSLRRIEPAKKSVGPSRAGAKPSDRLVQSDYETPLLSTYKLETKTKEGATSEPESGYRTDTSATYSQVEEKVAEIQLKIKRLKARATSGDDVTLTLVKDLQTELQHFERLLTEKEKSVKYKKPDRTAVNTPDWQKQEDSIEYNGQSLETPTPKARAALANNQQTLSLSKKQQQQQIPRKLPVSVVAQSSKDVSPRQEDAIDDLLIEDSVVKGIDDVTVDKVAMSMSKKELLDEMRKEKHQHHRQIRQLQSELKRMRETDAASTMELNSDDIVYREEDIVGEGAFSQVFRGTYQGTEVAIKRLATPLAAQDRNYFSAEVSLLRELRHPRVVLLIGVCTSDKLPLMVLEFMSNGSLFNHLHNGENEPLDHAEYYQVARDVALGMNYLHSHKPEVLHLDLKSMNVLLCQSFRAKIADFGFSKLRHDASAKLTQKGKPKPQRGSPAWMAPELVDKGEITCKADVYGFAMILWEMLTRKIPYENASVFQVLEMVRKNKRPEIPRSCPEGLRQLISRCWDQNPAKRPHFKDIVSALENLAFPPAWRELFHKAGVPEEALHNIESTRTLINLVTTTLDSNSFSSFMISDSKEKRVQPGEASSVTSGDTASTCIPRRAIVKTTDDWESGTVSDITEISTERKSEFSLGSLGDSADESLLDSDAETITENYGDGSSELSSDDDSIVLPASSRRKSPRKKINVFVPNLQLSMKSPPVVDSVKEENSKFDWLSISLDDRTSREDRESYRSSLEEQFLDLNLSSKSNMIVMPVISEVSSASSKQQNQRKSWQEKAKQMDEYLMRESINNRRPPSPTRKRRSLTKKLVDRNNRSLDIDDTMDNSVQADRMIYTDRPLGISQSASNDLTSLNRKLEELNSQTLDLIHKKSSNKSVPPQEHLQNTYDSGQEFGNTLTFDEPVRVTLKNSADSGSERNIMSVRLTNEKSYDSFFSLPVENQVSTEGAFRKSETSLTRSGSFTKSKDVLDLLATQIKNTTKTLATMDKESAASISASEVNRNSYNSVSKDLEQALSSKQSVDNFSRKENLNMNESTDMSRIAPKSAVNNKNINADTSKSIVTNKVVGKNVKTGTSVIKLPPKTVTLDEYHKFVHKDILHDSGGSIESLKSPKAQKSDEGASTINTTEKNLQSVAEPRQASNDTKSDIINVEKCTDEESTLEIGTKFADVEHEQETDCKETFEEKESIRVKLNPSDLINKKPVKTPRRSKMKESLDASEVNGMEGENEVKLLSDNFKVDSRSNEHTDITNLSEDEVVKKLKALEDFSELEPNIMDESEIPGPSETSTDQVSKNEIVVKGKTKQSIQKDPKVTEDIDTESSLIKKTNSASETSHTSNKTDKVKLVVKDEHWRKLPEKPKEKKGKSNSDERSKNKSVTDTSKTATKVDDKSKISEKPTKTIRVKLKKDPLKPVLSEGPPSPVPPAPPPPPLTSLSVSTVTFSRSAQVPRPATSMADELKLRVESWQSRSYQKNIMKSKHEPVMRKSAIQSKGFPVMSKKFLESVTEASSTQLDDSLEDFELSDDQLSAYEGSVLVPQQSDGLPAFALQSFELRDQRDHLKSISKPHPDQLDDLSHVSKEQLSSIAVLLKKAVSERRLALGEDSASVDQSMDSVSWSVETTPHPTPRL